jgi:hypothetical protein
MLHVTSTSLEDKPTFFTLLTNKRGSLSYLGKKQTNTVATNIAVYAIITVHNTK